jgi:hypothetical protein
MVPERQSSLIQLLDVTDQTLGAPVDLVTVPELSSGVKIAVNADGAVVVATQATVELYRANGDKAATIPLPADHVRRIMSLGEDFLIHSGSGVATVDGRTGEIIQQM